MLGLIKEEEENENRSEFKGGQCGLHKIQAEFICVNQACKGYLSSFCSKCAMKYHRDCEVDSWTEDIEAIKQQQQSLQQLQQTFVEEAKQLKLKINAMFDDECDGISKSILRGNQITSEAAKKFIDLCKKANSSINPVNILPGIKDLGKAVSVFEDLILESRESLDILKGASSYASSVTNENTQYQLNESSFSTLSFNSHRQHSHPDQQLNRLESISFNSYNNPNLKEDLSFSSMRSQISNISSSCTASSSSSAQRLSLKSAQKRDSPSRAISITNIKGKKFRSFKINSQYVESFCLFETHSNVQSDNQTIETTNPSQLQLNSSQKQPSSSQNPAKYFLITRCEKQAMSVIDLEQQKEISRISFTHNSKLISFKQLSETQVVIYSPQMSYIWIQDLFQEKNFIQVDFGSVIDSLTIDVSLGLVFCAHHFGKISVWSIDSQTQIVNGFKAHNKAISMMDYNNGQLLTCCTDGSVKQFNFSNQNQVLTFLRTLIQENKDQTMEDKATYVKIIDNSTVIIQISDEFVEVYKNGVPSTEDSDNTLEYFYSLNDMKIYESRYGILRSIQDEHIACVYDFQKHKLVKQLEINEEKAIIGAYFLQGHIVLLLDDKQKK